MKKSKTMIAITVLFMVLFWVAIGYELTSGMIWHLK